jgi:hypothetical protein
VSGKVPFTPGGYHGFEIGAILEFVVMLPEMDSAEASCFAERVRQAVLGMRVRTVAGR